MDGQDFLLEVKEPSDEVYWNGSKGVSVEKVVQGSSSFVHWMRATFIAPSQEFPNGSWFIYDCGKTRRVGTEHVTKWVKEM